jgi:hypothetical protein
MEKNKTQKPFLTSMARKIIAFSRTTLYTNGIRDSGECGLILPKSQEENQMSRHTLAFILVGLVIFFNSAAQAGLVSFYSDAVSTWSPSSAVLTQGISSLAGADIIITAEAKSTFTITTTATNESGFTWTGYILSLDRQGDATFVEGTAGSTKFETVEYPDLWTVEFWAPKEVLPGQVVTLQFDINIPDSGPYTFTLAQNPIPEPMTIAILGLGSLYLLRKRRGV